MREQTLPKDDEMLTEGASREGHPAREQDKEVDLVKLGKILLSRKRLIAKFAFIPAIFAVVAMLVVKPTYTAEATFLPPNSMSLGASSMLSQLGALGGAGAALGGFKDPTLIYIGMLGSRTVADHLIKQFDLQKEYKTEKLSITEKVLAAHSKFISGKDTIITISVDDHDPKRAMDLANSYLAQLHALSDRIALTEAGQRRIFYEQQLEKEKDILADAEVELARTQQQSGLIQPSGQARLQMETIVQTQAEISSREIQLAAMSQAATDQNPDVIRIRSEIAGLRAQLDKLQNSSRQSGRGDIQVPTSKVPELTLLYVRKAREVKYHEALYELLLKQYSAARLDESRDAPLLQVIDQAVVPDRKSGPPRLLIVVGSFLLGAFLGVVWVIVPLFYQASLASPI